MLTVSISFTAKVVKKIDETRKRANQIVSQRQRNMMNMQAKEERQRKQQMDEAHRCQMNKQAKEQGKNTVNHSKMAAAARQKQLALETKSEKEMARMRNNE